MQVQEMIQKGDKKLAKWPIPIMKVITIIKTNNQITIILMKKIVNIIMRVIHQHTIIIIKEIGKKISKIDKTISKTKEILSICLRIIRFKNKMIEHTIKNLRDINNVMTLNKGNSHKKEEMI